MVSVANSPSTLLGLHLHLNISRNWLIREKSRRNEVRYKMQQSLGSNEIRSKSPLSPHTSLALWLAVQPLPMHCARRIHAYMHSRTRLLNSRFAAGYSMFAILQLIRENKKLFSELNKARGGETQRDANMTLTRKL